MDKNQELLIDKPVTDDVEIEKNCNKLEINENLQNEEVCKDKKKIPYKTLATVGLLSAGALAVTKAFYKKEENDVPEEWQEIASRIETALLNSNLTYQELLAHLTATYSQNVIDYVLEVLDDVIIRVATRTLKDLDNISGMITPHEAVTFLVEGGYPKRMIREALTQVDLDWHEHTIYFATLLLEEEPDMNKNTLYFKLRRKPYSFTHEETQYALKKLYN